MSDAWSGNLQFRVVLVQIRPVHRCESWSLVHTRIKDRQLVTKVDTLSSILKTPPNPYCLQEIKSLEMPEKLSIVHRWPTLLSPVGLYHLSSLLLPSFSLALPHPSQNFILHIPKVHTALPLVPMPQFFRETIPDARVQRYDWSLL